MVVCGNFWEKVVLDGWLEPSSGELGLQRMLFLGRHDYSMDERGRIPMPPRYREALMHGIVLTEGTPDRCLRAYPMDEFEKTAANYMSSPISTSEGRLLRRKFFSAAHDTELDRQGR